MSLVWQIVTFGLGSKGHKIEHVAMPIGAQEFDRMRVIESLTSSRFLFPA